MIQFKNISDLDETVRKALPNIPRDLDLIAGIPRSGLLVANMLALYLNIPMTDLKGLVEGRTISVGKRTLRNCGESKRMKVLVVDDSVGGGTQMKAARTLLSGRSDTMEILFAAAYVTPESRHLVDIAFEVLPFGRCFAWNLMHHRLLEQACVTLEGVICRTPENEGSLSQALWSAATLPVFLPTPEVGWLVTTGPESLRERINEWLSAHNVRFRELRTGGALCDRSSTEEQARFKAALYRTTGAKLFIDAGAEHCRRIAEIAGLPVLCITTQKIFYPAPVDRLRVAMSDNPKATWKRILGSLRRRVSVM